MISQVFDEVQEVRYIAVKQGKITKKSVGAKETQIIKRAKSREIAGLPLSGEEKCYVNFAILQAQVPFYL